MKRVMSLFGVLSKNAEMKVPSKGSKGRMYLAIGVIALSCIMIPCCIIVGFVSYIMTEAMIAIDAPATNGILAEIHIMSAFSIVFGTWVIFNILFFSSDREHIVPLPFKSWEILLAKFLYSYLAESVMEFMILISMFVGFFISYGFSISGIISALVGVVLIPLIPMAYCAIIGLVMLVVLRGVKNGKVFDHISTVLMLLFVGVFLYSFKGMGSITVENYMVSIGSNANFFTNTLNKIFFTVPVLTKAIESNNLLWTLLYIAGNILVLVILVLIGKFTYSEALYTVARLGSGKKKKVLHDVHTKERSVALSYFLKEIRVLVRTKAYSNNCVYINFLWPILIGGYLWWNRDKEAVMTLRRLFDNGYDKTYMILTMAVIMLSFIASAMNSLASTAYTREGRHIELLKYIPVPYSLQVRVKACISIVLTLPAMLICSAIIVFFFGLNPVWILFHGVLVFMTLVVTTALGMYMDSSHPHLLWDDEYSALRGNLNTFYDMALVMVIAILICAIGLILNGLIGVPAMFVQIYFFVILLIMAIFAYIKGFKAVIKNMDEL